MRGLGTVINAIAIVIGGGFGAVAGHRLSPRTRDTVTDALGLVVLVIGALNIMAIRADPFTEAVGSDWTLLVVLGALLIGGIIGSTLRIEDRIESLGGFLRDRLVRSGSEDVDARTRFIDGFVSMSLFAHHRSLPQWIVRTPALRSGDAPVNPPRNRTEVTLIVPADLPSGVYASLL